MHSDQTTRICVPLSEKSLNNLTSAVRAATSVADLIELRLDGLEANELSPTKINDLVNAISKPVVLTFRPTEQGGGRSLTIHDRLSFWETAFKTNAAFFDIESDLVAELVLREPDFQPDWSRVICSHHDFHSTKSTQSNLNTLYEQLANTPARILKIAVQATTIVDCVEVFQLLDVATREERETIAIAMGNAGVVTRVLGPSRGSFLTYGALKSEKGTAPGQVVAHELRSLYRLDQIDGETMITGLVGLPVMHSVSPHIHNAAFQSANVNGVYVPLEVVDVREFFKRMVDPRTRELEWNLRGLSITAPHKLEVMACLDWIDPRAKAIGAVNTVVLENEQLLGYNTDADGLVEPLLKRVGALDGSRVAVIGAGGAASAAVFALQERNADVSLYTRDVAKGRVLADRFKISCESLASTNFADKDVVINATPLGSSGPHRDETPATTEQLRGCRLVYDLVYTPRETLLMSEALKAGCEVLDGLEMLIAQASQQFKYWTQTTVSSEIMYTAAAHALDHKT
jgi:3-dehydroquinate dehydratase / shikimate dehydrogenase